MRRKRRQRAHIPPAERVALAAPPATPVEPPRGRRDALVRAALHNAWILAGVFLLGWSAGTAIGASYLETLLTSIGLAIAVLVTGRGEVETREGTAGKVTRETVIAGFALGAFGLVFLVSILLQQTLEVFVAAWSHDLAFIAAGALLAAAIDFVIVHRSLRVQPDGWVRRRVDRQQNAMFALMLLLLVVPWTFLLIGEKGMIATLFVLKALLDAWTAAPADGG